MPSANAFQTFSRTIGRAPPLPGDAPSPPESSVAPFLESPCALKKGWFLGKSGQNVTISPPVL